MNQDQMLSLLRSALKVIGTLAVAHGVGNESMWSMITGVIMVSAPIVWDWYVHSTQGKLQAVTAIDPGIKIVATQSVIDNHPAVAAAVNDPAQPQIAKAA